MQVLLLLNSFDHNPVIERDESSRNGSETAEVPDTFIPRTSWSTLPARGLKIGIG